MKFGHSLMLAGLAAGISLAPPVQAQDWNGAYTGLNAGYGKANVDVSNMQFEGEPSGIPDFTIDSDGYLAGITLGYNVQNNALVYGIEGDLDYSAIQGEDDRYDGYPGFTSEAEIGWLSTVRARLGVTTGKAMFYGTAGMAAGSVKGTIHDNYGEIITTSDTNIQVGWTAGGGMEFAVNDNVSIKAEYLYYDLGKDEISVNEGLVGWNPMTADVTVTGSIVRTGINFRF